MPTTLQFRRYGTAATASVTGANGELTIDTDKETVVVHDGSTAGGYALVRDGAATISDTFGNLRGSEKSTSYTLAANDVGRLVIVTTSGSITVPNTTFGGGNVVSVYNNTSSNVVLTLSTAAAYVSGNNTNRTSLNLATRGIATVLYISSNSCVITGSVS
jgi:hypothetical protein